MRGAERNSAPLGRRVAAVVGALAMTAAACSGGTAADDCTRTADPDSSAARVWNETLLDAIRRDFPAPTVHSRNLFHVSAAMWDAWAAYDPDAQGYFVTEKAEATDVAAAREEAISHAAYGVLTHRYSTAVGGDESLADFDAAMASLCFDAAATATAGDAPAALGNRIAAVIVDFGKTDGSLEGFGYADFDDDAYRPVNPPLVVAEAGTEVEDPNRWQPLAFEIAESQNGLLLPSKIQTFVGPYWGQVAGFALPHSATGLPLDPGPPPYLGDPATDADFKSAVLEVIRHSSLLDPADGAEVDISPASLGDNPLGTNDGGGYAVNPFTGEPYDPNVVAHGDFARVLAEFWADGPASETPPGHWNTLANSVSDHPALERRIGGTGPALDRLEWDVKLYFALNGAVHDAAVAAWGAKGHYDYTRPITMIRYMGGRGQSTDPGGPGYDPEGLPLEEGLVELVTADSAGPGQRHAHLADHIGEVAIRTWQGAPADPDESVGGVGWIRAVEWVPYQKSTFVTPAFAGYVSGHSAFSRAAAEVMRGFTGNAFFPGGLGEWTIPAGALEFEAGPSEDITLQWATYYDAADQAGRSRLYGGIHVRADDFAGRKMGAICGKEAWALAQRYFGGDV